MTDAYVPNPDPAVAFPPPPNPVGDYFALDNPAPPADTFEIGLVLGGTVSAAAYTAGVLDFLVQALDAWTVAKNAQDPAAPAHKVRIKILAGTSGGAISCALFARALGSAFPHCVLSAPETQRALNPFYDCWVNQIDIRDLLQLGDLERSPQVSSLLCADKIDQLSTAMAGWRGQPLGTGGTPRIRDYIEQQLPIVLTLTNLRGIPYSSDFRSTGRALEYYTDHADHIRFRVDIAGAGAAEQLQPYEVGISDVAGAQPWSNLIHCSRGSSAFPVGLPPQQIARDLQHYRYRYALIEGTSGSSQAVWMRPAWAYMTPVGSSATSPYTFLCVDGGCFNNEPTEYARQWLAGVLGTNPRDGGSAHRAVILVDPFADVPGVGLMADQGVLNSASAALSGWVGGARFETADLDLFTADDVFSRFLVNPVRYDANNERLFGGDAIATNCLAAFGGFLSSAFRAHDFFLGRRNCQQFLQQQFVLPLGNALFSNWTSAQLNSYSPVAPGFLPIVPLMPTLQAAEPQPDWPKGSFDPASIRDLLDGRIAKLSSCLASAAMGDQGLLGNMGIDFIVGKLGDMGADKAIDAINQSLRQSGLR